MSENINAHCAICNRGYHICNSCAEQKKLKPWRSVTDTIDHYKIYLAIHGYTISKNKEQAKKELESCNLFDLESYNPEIKKVIKEIISEPKRAKTSTKKKEENIEIVPEAKTENINE